VASHFWEDKEGGRPPKDVFLSRESCAEANPPSMENQERKTSFNRKKNFPSFRRKGGGVILMGKVSLITKRGGREFLSQCRGAPKSYESPLGERHYFGREKSSFLSTKTREESELLPPL